PAEKVKAREVNLAARDASAGAQRVPSADVGQGILEVEMVLDQIQPLSVAAERQRAVDADHRKVVRAAGGSDSDIRPFEDFLLDGRRRNAVEPELRLIQQRGAEGISVRECEVPHPGIRRLREAGRRSRKLRGWKG